MKISITIDETFGDADAAIEFLRSLAALSATSGRPVYAPAPVVAAKPVAKPEPASIIPDTYQPAEPSDDGHTVPVGLSDVLNEAPKAKRGRKPKAANPDHVPVDPALTAPAAQPAAQPALPLEPAPAAEQPKTEAPAPAAAAPSVRDPWADTPAPAAVEPPKAAAAAPAPSSAVQYTDVAVAFSKAQHRARKAGRNIDNDVMDLLKNFGATNIRALKPESYGEALAKFDALCAA